MKNIKIIAYGTLKHGQHNHRFCGQVISIKPCSIKGTLYDTGWGYPAFVPCGNSDVQAELIEITPQAWASVDQLEGYPRLYNRVEYLCTLADGTTETGWGYIMNSLPSQATIIGNGNWI